MSQSAATLKSVVLWSLPNYAVVVVLVGLAFVASTIPLRVQHTVAGVWMLFALLLPISTIMAAVKTVQLSLRAADQSKVHHWRPVVAWCLVGLALAFNVFSCIVISRTLR
jgi:hypothetical protein